MKCTDDKWKLEKILGCRFEGKKTEDQAHRLKILVEFQRAHYAGISEFHWLWLYGR